MEIKQFGHLAFNCKNQKKSVEFYRDILGLNEKFSLYYDSFIEIVKNTGIKLPKVAYKLLEKKKDNAWLTYIEIGDGIFIELFDQLGAFITNRPAFFHNNYQHFALIVEDIYKTKQELTEKGVKIDIDISFGPDKTYQMWIHDPDGNKIEIMQYTEESFQVVK